MIFPSVVTTAERLVKEMTVDHLGNEFRTVHDMCKHWHLSYDTLRKRLKKGLSLEKTLTTAVQDNRITDHTGQEFDSKTAMCKKWGIPVKRFTDRIEKGMSLEEALTAPIKSLKQCKDHLGNKYDSLTDMAAHYGLSLSSLINRRKIMSLEEALTRPHGSRGTVTDHTGRTFRSITDMCKFWHIPLATYTYRINKGWSIEKALTLIPRNTVINDNLTVVRLVENNFYECIFNNKKVILSENDIRTTKTKE